MIPIFIKIGNWIKSRVLAFFAYCHRQFLAVLRRLGKWLLAFGEPRPTVPDAPDQTWKNEVLADFQDWLEALPASPPATEAATPEACDLFTLLAEFSSLRQEIKLQNREQHKVTLNMDGMLQAYQESMRFFQQNQRDMGQLAGTIAHRVEKETVLPFLSMRDALVRGHQAALGLQATKSFFRRPPPGLDGVVEGYAMALRRFDRGLDKLEIRHTPTVNHPFNARTMRAISTTALPEKPRGIVIEEHLSGFVRGEEVIRTAEVVVNEY